MKEREEMAEHWKNVCGRVMNMLKEYMGRYCLSRLGEFGECFVVEIKEGCLQFQTEIEGHLISADGKFRKLYEDSRRAMGEIERAFKQHEERNVEFEPRIQHLTSQNQQKDIENKTLMGRLSKMEYSTEEQGKRFANTHRRSSWKNYGGSWKDYPLKVLSLV